MNINIYYGGRGLIDDPTLFVIGKIQEVLVELRVTVKKYNLYEYKNEILTLPQTLKDVDGVILASTVEWYGVGGNMQQFLDACWLYGDKGKIAKTYMCPVVMSTTYGEREGMQHLSAAWEMLGGMSLSGLCGYIADTVALEMNEEYLRIIEKKAENLYRSINQKTACFPASNKVVVNKLSTTQNIDLTPQETEQLSHYISDDTYVKRQKEDIQELTSLFRDMLEGDGGEGEFISDFQRAFKPQADLISEYLINIEEKKNALVLRIKNREVECFYGEAKKPEVEMNMNRAALDDIVNGRMTFQRAFMSGTIRMKGDFKLLRSLDQIFVFEER
ncbi:SCP2 sterol-binding domain-containing protein [Lachnospiraceae bacterium OttesenSCG-928-D06]|nr:SCP2 sterol-binding domain-containing protein [Lachnospiraceae bacterium OttesenSCG-928-D06]